MIVQLSNVIQYSRKNLALRYFALKTKLSKQILIENQTQNFQWFIQTMNIRRVSHGCNNNQTRTEMFFIPRKIIILIFIKYHGS